MLTVPNIGTDSARVSDEFFNFELSEWTSVMFVNKDAVELLYVLQYLSDSDYFNEGSE